MSDYNDLGSRYLAKPFLRLLECYVLDVIGELPPLESESLDKMTPRLQAVYGINEHWKEIIHRLMHFSSSIDDHIRAVWERCRNQARAGGEELQPDDFARMFVDRNLAN